MDGTYQNPYNRSHLDSPLSPDTPQSASYRANVNRTKTRKWVEAKTQNYDGDDWGGDDYGDEPAPVPAVPPLRPSGSRQASYASGRLPSEPPMPSIVPQQQQQQQYQPPAERTRDSGPPPSLHIHTQPQAAPVAPVEANPYATGTDREPPMHGDLPSRVSDRSTPPLSQEPAAAYYAAYDQAQAAQSNEQNVSKPGAFDAAAAPNLQETIASGRDAHGPRDAPAQPQHLLQEHHQPQPSADPNLTSDAPSPQLEVRPARVSDDQTGQPPHFAAYPDSSQAEETKRFSTSPQLPDLARMSMFGDDLFSGSATRFSTDVPPVPTLPEEPTPQQLPQREQSTSPAAVAGDAEAQSSTKSIDASPEVPTSNMTTVAPQTGASPSLSPSPSPQPAAEPALAPPKPFRPSLPGDWVSDSVTSFDQGSYNDRNPSVNEGSQKAAATSSKDTDSDAGVGRSASPAVPVASSSPEIIHPSASSPKDAVTVVHPVDTVQDDFAPPEVLHRENTLNSIASPSPIKESDKLREEIIRSLSPVRPTHEAATASKPQEPSEFDPPTRESTYLHGVYDDYWTGGDDKQTNEAQPAVPELRSSPVVVEPMPEIQPLSPRSPLRDVSTERDYPSIDSRPRRFSWEGGAEDSEDDSNKETAPATSKVQPVPVVDLGLVKPAETPSSVSEPEAEPSVRGGSELPSRLAETARLNSQDDASQISHQVSQVSSLPRGGDQSFFAAPQPPSPVSVASEATPSAEPKSLSLLDEKARSPAADPTAPKLVTDDDRQGLDVSTAPSSPQVPLKIMSFREILELPNAADRISKYDETRQQFAQMDSGLNSWLVNVKAQHPDHANASPMFHGGQVVMPGTPHGLDQAPQNTGAGGGGAAPTQQPYYQQYLNASSPTTSSTPGRPLTGTLGGGSHSSTSDFKHSSGQVGAKGKGLLLAAGKAGKGLLSKGKDKLRRDKNDEPPSPAAPAAAASPLAPTQPKPDRRSSWALSLSGRSGTRDGGGPPPPHSLSQLQPQHQQQFQSQHQHQRSVSDSAPQIPQPTRVSPFGADVGQESQWQPPHQLQTQQQQRNVVAGHQRSDTLADELVSPVSDSHSLLGREELGDVRKPAAPVAGDEKIDDWVMVESQRAPATGGQVPFAAATAAVASAQAQAQAQAPDRRNSRAESPTKNNSFIGLPPIRRGSTFGLNYTRKAKERFSLDEDEMNDPDDPRSGFPGPSDTSGRPMSQQGEERSRRGSGTLVNDAAIASAQARLQGQDTHAEDTLGGSSTLGPRNSHDSEEVDVGDDPEKKPIPMAPTVPAQNRTQRAVSEQPRAMPGMGTVLPEGNPVQHVPPQGWNLQQSHLSAPLLSASRSRQFFTGPSSPGRPPAEAQQPAEPQGAGPQQQENLVQSPVQETSLRSGLQQPGPQPSKPQQFGPPQPAPGAPSAMGPPQSAPDAPQHFGAQQPGPQNFGRPDPNQGKPQTMMPPRQKFSETPPSSARRYPGLFSGVAGGPPPPGVQGFPVPSPEHLQQQQQQQLQGAPRKSSDLPPNMYQAPLGRQETLLQRTQSGEFQVPGIGPPEDDDRGRGRRSSGFFKEIGERFRSASRDRRTSMSEQRGPAPPQGLPHQQSSMANEIRPDDVSIISSNATEEANDKKKKRRSSFFMNLRGPKAAAAAEDARDDASSINSSNFASSAPGPQPIGTQDRRRSFFGVPTGPSNLGLPALSRSSTTSNTNEPEGSISSQNTSKRRLSAMTGKLFNRSSSNQQEEQHPKPGTSQSMAPSIQSSRHSALVNTQPAVPSPLAGPGRQRSDTTGSAPNMNRVMTNASQIEPPPEENRGRRVTGSFLTGLFNRSSSKTRESNSQPQRLPQQNQGPMNQSPGQFGPPQGPAGRGAPLQGQQQFPQGPQQVAQDPRQFPQQPGGRGAPPQGPQQLPPGHPGLPRQPSGQGPPVFMQGQQQWQKQGPNQQGPQGFPQGGRPASQQQPQPGAPNGFATAQQPWPRQGSDDNQSPPPGAPRSVPGQGPQQWAQAPNLNNQQPPPFRTQGPPVHPIAGVSPPSRSPASFPDQDRGGFQPPAKTSSPDLVPDQGRRVSHPYGPDDVQAPKSPVPETVTQAHPNGSALTNGQQAPGHFAVNTALAQGFTQTAPQEARQTQSPPALHQQISVSPSSSPEMTSGNRVQPLLASKASEEPAQFNEGAAAATVRSEDPHPVAQPCIIASSGGLVIRQTQHPSIRKPTPADRLSASPQPAIITQTQQGDTRGSSQDPSASSSIYPDQDEPQSSLASSTPPAPQQQKQQPAPLGSNPVQRVSSAEQGQQKPFEHIALQQNGGPPVGQGRGQAMGQGPQGQQGQQSPPQGPGAFAQGPPQGPQGPQGQQSPPQGPQGPQGFAQGPSQGPQGQLQGPPGPVQGPQGARGPFQGRCQGPPGPSFPQGPMQGPGHYQGQFVGRGQGRGQGIMPGQVQGPGQFMGPSPPPTIPPVQAQTSGFRKLFRGKSEQPSQPTQQTQGHRPPLQQQPTQVSQMSQMSQHSQQQPLPQQSLQAEKKEKSSGKSLFGAFKRSSKQPEPHGKQSPLPQQMGRGFPPPGPPGSGPQQTMMGPQGPFNPQQQPNMQGQMPPHVQQQMMMQNRPPPPPGFQYETPMQGPPQGPQPLQNQQLPQPGAQTTEGLSIVQPTPQQPNMQPPPPDNRKGSPPYLQYQQERVSPETVPVPGQKMPQLQQRGSSGPGPSPGLQQRQSLGPGPIPGQLQQRPSFGPGQGPMQLQQQGQNVPPNMGRGGPPQAQQFPPHGYREQQYESVPIPRGYAAVHADGSIVDPSPRGMYGSPQARSQSQFQGPGMQQSSPPLLQQQQSWQQQPQQAYPPAQFQGHQQVNQSPPQPGNYMNPPPQSVQQQQQQHHHQPSPPAQFQQGHQVQPQQQQQTPPPMQFQQGPQVQAQPLVQQQPPQQQLPPTHREQSPHQGQQGPQYQAQPLAQQQPQQQQSVRPQGSITRKPPAPAAAAAPQQTGAADEPPVKNGVKGVPEPTTPAEGSRLKVNVQKANQGDHDDIYDATPRKQPLERQQTGESQISISSTEEAARKANGAAKKSKGPPRVIRVNSTRAELEDTEDERKRTIRLEAQEEKILYDPNEDGPSAGRRKEEAEAPQMSATSYPGMEWNPYANGNYDDWND